MTSQQFHLSGGGGASKASYSNREQQPPVAENAKQLPGASMPLRPKVLSPSQSHINESQLSMTPVPTRQTHQSNSEVDSAIMNVYSRVKNLENRYIDLANFYKEALVRQERAHVMSEDESVHREDKLVKMTTSPRGLSQSLAGEADSPGMKREETVRENQMIRELINEKRQLEENIQGMKQTIQQCTSNAAANEPMSRAALQQQLAEVFSDLFDCVDGTQVQSLSLMNSKQNAMFQMCTHHKLASSFRNESLGLWYDAKSDVTGCIAELKSQLIERKTAFEAELGISVSTENGGGSQGAQGSSVQSQPLTNKKLIQAHERMVDEFEDQFSRLHQAHQASSTSIHKALKHLKQKETEIIEERAKSSLLLQEMNESLATQENIFEKRLSVHKQRAFEQQRQYESGKSRTTNNMSSFDRRLQSYQNSSITRGQRSSSRGTIPSSQANADGKSSDKDSSMTEPIEQSSQELRVLRLTLQKFGASFDSYSDAIKQKSRIEGQLSKHINDTLAEFAKVISHGEQLLEKQLTDPSLQQKIPTSSTIKQPKMNSSRRTNSPLKPGKGTPVSSKRADSRELIGSANRRPDSASRQPGPLMPQVTQQAHDAKVHDLNNKITQQFNDLRREKEAYKELRKENGRLRDQIISLKHNLDYYQQAQRVQEKQNAMAPSNSGRNLSKTQREDQPPLPTKKFAGSSPVRTSARQTQSSQERSSGGNIGKLAQAQTQEMAARVDHLCDFIQQFMSAMRQLQKAVNGKNQNLTSYKHDFERTKKQLEKYVTEVKGISKSENLGLQKQYSMPIAGKKPLSNRQGISALQIESENMNPVGGTQRSKPDTSKLLLTETGEASRQIQAALQHQPQPTTPIYHSPDNSQVAALLKQSSTLQAERQMMKKLIEELRSTVRQGGSEREQLEVQLSTKAQQLARLQGAFTLSQGRAHMLEQILSEYRLAFAELESTAALDNNGVSAEALSRIKAILAERENNEEEKLAEEQQEMEPNQDPALAVLKAELVAAIRRKSDECDSQMLGVQARLADKENDLQRVKLLFVDKLRELETSFVEISKDMIENDSIQLEEDTRQQAEMHRMREQLERAKTEQDRSQNLERSVEHVLSKFEEDDREQELQNLTQANAELVETIDQLQKQLKQSQEQYAQTSQTADVGQAQMVLQLNDQIEQLRHDNKEHVVKIKDLEDADAVMQKELKSQRYNLKSAQMSRKDDKERFESVKEQLQDALSSLRQQCMRFETQMQKEYDARVRAETELSKNLQRLRKATDVVRAREGELEEMTKYIKNLEDEHKYERMLREPLIEDDPRAAEKDEEDETAELELRIEEDGAKATAKHYAKLAAVGTRESRRLKTEVEKNNEDVDKMLEETAGIRNTLEERSQERDTFAKKVEEVEEELASKKDEHDAELAEKTDDLGRLELEKDMTESKLQLLEEVHSVLTAEKYDLDHKAASLSIQLETTIKTKDREVGMLAATMKQSQRSAQMSRLAVALHRNLQNRLADQVAHATAALREQEQNSEVSQIQVKQLWDNKVQQTQALQEQQREKELLEIQIEKYKEDLATVNGDNTTLAGKLNHLQTQSSQGLEEHQVQLEVQVQELKVQSKTELNTARKSHQQVVERTSHENKLALALHKHLQRRLERELADHQAKLEEANQNFEIIQVDLKNLNVEATASKQKNHRLEGQVISVGQEREEVFNDKLKLENHVLELNAASALAKKEKGQMEQDYEVVQIQVRELQSAKVAQEAALNLTHEEKLAQYRTTQSEEKAGLQEQLQGLNSQFSEERARSAVQHEEELAKFSELTSAATVKITRENKLAIALHRHLKVQLEKKIADAATELSQVQTSFGTIQIEVQNLNVASARTTKNHAGEKASLEKQIGALTSLKETQAAETRQLESELEDVRGGKSQIEQDTATELKEGQDALIKANSVIAEKQSNLDALSEDIAAKEHQLGQKDDQIRLTEHEKVAEKAKREQLEKDIVRKESEFDGKLRKIGAKIEEKTSQLSLVNEEMNQLQSHLKDQADSHSQEHSQMASAVTNVKEQLVEAESTSRDLGQKLKASQNLIKEFENARDSLESDLEREKQNSAEWKQRMDNLTMDIQKGSQNESVMEKALMSKQMEINQLQADKDLLEEQVAQGQSYIATNKILNEKLDQVQENASELDTQLKEQQRQVIDLEGQLSTEKLEQEELQAQYTELEQTNQHLQRDYQSQQLSYEILEQKKTSLESDKNSLEQSYQQLQEDHNELKQMKDDLSNRLNNLISDHETIQTDKTELQRQIESEQESLNSEICQHKETIEQQTRKLNSLDQQHNELKDTHNGRIEEFNADISAYKETIDQQKSMLSTHVSDSERDKESSSLMLNESEGKIQELNTEISTHKSTIEKTVERMTELSAAMETAQSDNHNLKQTLEDHTEKLSSSLEKHQTIELQFGAAQERISELKEQIILHIESLGQKEGEINGLEEVVAAHEKSIGDKKEQINNLERQLTSGNSTNEELLTNKAAQIEQLEEQHNDQKAVHKEALKQKDELFSAKEIDIAQLKLTHQEALSLLQGTLNTNENEISALKDQITENVKSYNETKSTLDLAIQQNSLKDTKIKQFAVENEQMATKLEMSHSSINDVKAQVDMLSEHLKVAQLQLTDKNSTTNEAFQKLEETRNQLKEDQEMHQKSRAQLAIEQSLVKRLEKEAQLQSKEAKDLQETLNTLQSDLEQHRDTLDEREQAIQSMKEEQVSRLQAEIDDLINQLDKAIVMEKGLTIDNEELNEQVERLTDDVNEQQKQFETTIERVEDEKTALEQKYLKKINSFKESLQEKEQVEQTSQEIYAEDMIKFNQVQSDLEQMQNDYDAQTVRLNEVQLTCAAKDEKIALGQQAVTNAERDNELNTDKLQVKIAEQFKKQEELLVTIEKLNLEKVEAMKDKEEEIDAVKRQLEKSGEQLQVVAKEAEENLRQCIEDQTTHQRTMTEQEIEAQRRRLIQEMADLKRSHADTINALTEQNKNLQSVSDQVKQNLEEEVTRKDNQLQQALKRNETLDSEKQDVIQQNMTQTIENDNNYKDLMQQLGDQEALYIEIQGQLDMYKLDVERLESERDDLLEGRDERVAELEAQLEAMEADQLLQEASNDGESLAEMKAINEQLTQDAEGAEIELNQLKLQLLEAQQKMAEESKPMRSDRENSWERSGDLAGSQVIRGRDSWGSQGSKGKSYEAEIEEHMQHVRHILEQFLCKLPISNKDNEDMLNIVYSMMSFKKEQIQKINTARDSLSVPKAEEKPKKGIFGFGRKK